MFKQLGIGLVACGLALPAAAREPNAPFAVPAGGTFGIPVGANPPPGQYLSFRFANVPGKVVDNAGNPIGVDADVSVLALVYSNVPGIELWGGTYRFTAIVPFATNKQNAFGRETNIGGIGDITISPLNLSWMTSPGTFVSAGFGINIPTGAHNSDGLSANLGTNAYSLTLSGGATKFTKDWTLSAQAALTINAPNKTSAYEYRSAPDLLIDASAYRNVGNDLSIGGLAYYRTQLGSDTCSGAPFPCPNGDAEQFGIGIGVTKSWGPTSLNVNYVTPIKTRNILESPQLQINYSIALGK